MIHLGVVRLSLAVPLAAQTWKPSPDRQPHFEIVNGKRLFSSGGLTFSVLAVETQWEELIYCRYADTMHAYDYMYPAATEMHLNALTVPIKRSVVEPSEGVFNFLSHVDEVKRVAERNSLRHCGLGSRRRLFGFPLPASGGSDLLVNGRYSYPSSVRPLVIIKRTLA